MEVTTLKVMQFCQLSVQLFPNWTGIRVHDCLLITHVVVTGKLDASAESSSMVVRNALLTLNILILSVFALVVSLRVRKLRIIFNYMCVHIKVPLNSHIVLFLFFTHSQPVMRRQWKVYNQFGQIRCTFGSTCREIGSV